ncbi:6980_t:CDS:2, partial [Gigaspora margarita]
FDIYDNMDNDNLLQVDKMDNQEEMNDNTLALIVLTNNETSSDKSIGSCRVEVMARELFPKLFHQKFSKKKLTYNQKQMLNHALYTESTWQIDRNRSDTVENIEKLHRKLIEEIVLQLHLHILSLGSDGTVTEFQAQQSILNT